MTKSAGQIFQKARVAKGLTQAELAKKSGVYKNTIAKIERGEQSPTFSTVKKLAKALDIDIQDIPG